MPIPIGLPVAGKAIGSTMGLDIFGGDVLGKGLDLFGKLTGGGGGPTTVTSGPALSGVQLSFAPPFVIGGAGSSVDGRTDASLRATAPVSSNTSSAPTVGPYGAYLAPAEAVSAGGIADIPWYVWAGGAAVAAYLIARR